MDLKYITKNDGYIIDRKISSYYDKNGLSTYTESGTMVLTEVLPTDNIEMEKSVTEYAFDNMKEDILGDIRKKYFVSDDEIVNFYFKGNIEKDDGSKTFIKFQDEAISVIPTSFNVDFEVELKVTPKNFLKVQYNNFVNKFN